MSTEANKAIARQFLNEVVSKMNYSLMDELIAPDYINYGFGRPMNRDEVQQVINQFHSGFPHLSVEVHDIIAEGDTVVGRYTLHGTHNGEFQGIPATGKQIAVAGMVTFRFTDGKITEDTPQFDQLGMLQQLGVVPVPDQAAG